MRVNVAKITNLSADIWELVLNGPFPYDSIQAGQFVNIRIGENYDHILRRPISIAAVDRIKQRMTIVLRAVGAGTKWLSERRVGDSLDVLGPLGHGFPIQSTAGAVLIVGGGIGVPPLYLLAKELQPIVGQLDILLGFRDQQDCFWLDKFAPLGNVTIATEDGSVGKKGYVTEAIVAEPYYEKKWQYLYSCGPTSMLRAIKELFVETQVKGYVSLEERMACGVGACYGCVCSSENKQAAKRICKEGPVFDWREVTL